MAAKRQAAAHTREPLDAHPYERAHPHRYEGTCATCGRLVFAGRYYAANRSSLRRAASASLQAHRRNAACEGARLYTAVLEG